MSKCETCHYWSLLPEERSPDYGVCVFLTGMQHVDCPPVLLKRELVIRTAATTSGASITNSRPNNPRRRRGTTRRAGDEAGH